MDFRFDPELPGSQGKKVNVLDYLIFTIWEEKVYPFSQQFLKQVYYNEYRDSFQNTISAKAEMFLRWLFPIPVLNEDQGEGIKA